MPDDFDSFDDLDDFDEQPPTVEALCAENGVTHVKINQVRAGLLSTMKVSGVVTIEGKPHTLSVWEGLASGRPSTTANPKMWLELDGDIVGNIDYGSFLFNQELPNSTKHPVMMAGTALQRICFAANRDLEDAVEAAIDDVEDNMNALALSTWPRSRPLREAGHQGSPEESTPLSTTLDRYAGLCAVGALSHLTLEPVFAGPILALKMTADSYWDDAEQPLTAWTGRRDGTPGNVSEETSAWLQVGDRIFDMAKGFNFGASLGLSEESIPALVASVNQVVALMNTAAEAIHSLDTPDDLFAVLDELIRLSGTAEGFWDLQAARDKAQEALVWNCSMNLLGGITITETETPHLSFDVAAVTVDPVTVEEAKLRVGWIPTPENPSQFTHSYQIGEAACLAHDDADIERLMATVPDGTRDHYLHVFDHMHQIAHAVIDYTHATAGIAVAQASTVDQPLNAIERHDLIHEVHKDALVIMNPVAWGLSGEPDLPSHEH